jgi:PPK2 family polyphosphate:nucleotide phosphotransferase
LNRQLKKQYKLLKIKLREISTKAPDDIHKKEAKKQLGKLQKKLFSLHNLMHAEGKHAVLVILQGLDASGKDGTVKHVFSHVNPGSCNVTSFKAPSIGELSHDWMWRIYPHFPAKGILEIHNRSHYEDVLMPAVYDKATKESIKQRMEFINAVENHLTVNGTTILKFYMHISAKEESKRLKKRKKDPTRHWKYDPDDHNTEKHFDEFMDVYDDILNKCNTVPWHVVPADQKWYRNYFIMEKIVQTLERFKMQYPKTNPDLKEDK